jgi:hypothetical protein
VIEATLARGGWNSEQEKADTLAYLEAARGLYLGGLPARP